MDLKVNTSRFAAYFAVGVAWRPPAQDNTLSNPAGGSASPGNQRIIDVKPQRVAPRSSQTGDPGRQPRRQGNIFAPQPKVTQAAPATYTPPTPANPAVRLVASPQDPGQIIDIWA